MRNGKYILSINFQNLKKTCTKKVNKFVFNDKKNGYTKILVEK